MRPLKQLFIIALFSIGLQFFLPFPAFAQSQRTAVIVNPIRGSDFWSYNYSILDTPSKEYQVIKSQDLAATWLIRFDALNDPNTVQFVKSLDNKQEVGLFLEVTPSLTAAAGITYNQSPDWHYARSILLTGYSPSDRERLIDAAFKKFQSDFGYYPKSVGAWWIDANSLSYMKDNYGIVANLDVADQFSTDQYQVWGQYFSTPFYPSKNNALEPAQDPDQKIGVVTIQWATRDPYNSYGNGVLDSTYSVQANDYLLHNLDSGYFKKILDIYPQTTVGLENDFSFDKYGDQYQRQIQILVDEQKQDLLNIQTMANFYQSYNQKYPDISPNVLISSLDPLGGNGQVVWYQTPKYRVGWFYGPYGSEIRDLKIYDTGSKESCFDKSCDSLNLADSFVSSIDDVRLKNGWVIDEGKIRDIKINQSGENITIDYVNQSGVARHIQFMPNDIEVNGKPETLSVAILNATRTKSTVVTSPAENFQTKFDYKNIMPQQLLDFGKFILFSIFFFLLPGAIISRKFWLAIPVGWAAFTVLSYFLGFIHLDIGLWLLPVISILILFRIRLQIRNPLKLSWFNLLVGILIIFGSITWLLTVIRSGLIYDYGMAFWGPNGHDAIWHLSLITELKYHFPPENPVFAGVPLSNYHYFFDLLLAKTSSLSGVNEIDLLFRFFPLFIAVFVGILAYKAATQIFANRLAALFSLFFIYFGGSFGWIISSLKDGSFGGESLFWAQQSISTLLNPPFAISLVLLFAGFYLFYKFFITNTKRPWTVYLSLMLLWGSLIEFKAYAGVLVLVSLAIFSVEQFILKKRKDYLLLTILCGILSLIVFLPNNKGSSSLFIFDQLWFIKTMILSQDRLDWVRLSMALQSGSLLKVVLGYGLGIIIFILGNLGTRILGFSSGRLLFKNRLLFFIALIGTIIPLLFVQTGTNWNSLQFFYYTLIVFDLFAGLSLAKVFEKAPKSISLVVLSLVVLLTIPTAYGTASQYIPLRPPAKISTYEIEALKFLQTQPVGTVLVVPFDKDNTKVKFSEPVPLFAYASTAYVSALSGHPTFVDDTINLDILGVDYKGRINDENDFIKLVDQSHQILKRNNISYIYLLRASNLQFDNGKVGIKSIFANTEVTIFKVL